MQKLWTRQPIHIFKIHVTHMLCKTSYILLWSNTLFQYYSVSPLCSQKLQKIKKFESKIFKRTISGKVYAEEALRIEVFV